MARNQPGGFPYNHSVATVLSQITQGKKLASLPARGARVHRVSYAPGHFMPEHAHETANVTVVVAGGMADLSESGTQRCEALGVLVKPSGSVHESVCGDRGAHTIVVEVEGALERSLRRRCGLFDREVWLTGGDAPRLVLQLWERVRTDPDPDAALEPWLEQLGALKAIPAGRELDPRVGAAASMLSAGPDQDQSVEGIARRVGLHPVSLTRLFRAQTGCSPSEFRRRQRVRRAADGLAGGQAPIARVALEAGFSDQSHLTREFRREAGFSPRRFRLLASA